ncbi:MAG: hypothetical protein R3B53_01820 [Candidatus Paceibacterota bacterium]
MQQLPNVSVSELCGELTKVLEQLIATAALPGAAVARLKKAGEDVIVPYIDDTYTGVVRFDCVLNERNELKILELNADYPDGLLLHDKTYSVLSEALCSVHEDAFLSYFPVQTLIHISYAKDAHFLDAYYTEAEVLARNGHQVSIGSGEPTLKPTWHRRCVESSKITAGDMEWCEHDRTQHLNSFALRTLGYKDLLATLSHPYVLKTFVVNSATRPLLLANQSEYVLKPANGCEGQGIFFGHAHDAVTWAKIIGNLPIGYIAQEYVQLPRQKVSVYEDGNVIEKELYFDICPHFFIKDGKVANTGHLLMRFSKSPVVNVALGELSATIL